MKSEWLNHIEQTRAIDSIQLPTCNKPTYIVVACKTTEVSPLIASIKSAKTAYLQSHAKSILTEPNRLAASPAVSPAKVKRV